MSSPAVCVTPETPLDEVMRLMDEHDVRHLPVLEAGHLAGVVSDRHLLEATGWLPERLRAVYQDPVSGPRTAGEIAFGPVATVRATDGVHAVTVEAIRQGLGCVVVTEGPEIAGVVTESDLMRAYLEACRHELDRALLDATVETYMTRSVRAIDHGSNLGEALRLMRELRVRHLPVVQAGQLIGVLSDRDVRRELGRGRRGDFPVSEAMSTDAVTTTPRTRISEAVGKMVRGRISSLPVLRDDELVGILTSADVLDHCMNHLRAPGVDVA